MLLICCLLINIFIAFYFDKKRWKAARLAHVVAFSILCFVYVFSLNDPLVVNPLVSIFGETAYDLLHAFAGADPQVDFTYYMAIVVSSVIMAVCCGVFEASEIISSVKNDNSAKHKKIVSLKNTIIVKYNAKREKTYIKLCSLLC